MQNKKKPKQKQITLTPTYKSLVPYPLISQINMHSNQSIIYQIDRQTTHPNEKVQIYSLIFTNGQISSTKNNTLFPKIQLTILPIFYSIIKIQMNSINSYNFVCRNLAYIHNEQVTLIYLHIYYQSTTRQQRNSLNVMNRRIIINLTDTPPRNSKEAEEQQFIVSSKQYLKTTFRTTKSKEINLHLKIHRSRQSKIETSSQNLRNAKE
eukprot:TRINITY_DN1329_c0_g1_i3.p1 TRINITY_DN1329_c0_g1~~TRINITY_DN1329_c0_g1_i3.p1  ORF type:complete len:233 (-),score=-8.15 TRINITY_DN1329_c0_g1_i3:558-1181(-)